MAYIEQSDIVLAIGEQAVLALADDDNDGVIDADVIAAVIARACAWVDACIAHNYTGPFPIAQATAPAIFKEAALYKAIQFVSMRKPDYVRNLPSDDMLMYERMATKLLKDLAEAAMRAPDYTAETNPLNTGVTVEFGVSDGVPAGVGGGTFSEGFGSF